MRIAAMNALTVDGIKLQRRTGTPFLRIAGCGCHLLALLAVSVPMAAVDRSQKDDYLFASDRVISVRVQVEPANVQRLAQQPHEYVSVRLRVDDGAFAKAELRLKGSGSFRPITDKPNLGLKVGEAEPGTRSFSHKRLLLNNSVQDSTLIRWKLASELFLKAGLPAARVNFARAEFNGRDLGLYLIVEPTDKVFLARHFRSPSGNLYEGSNNDVGDNLEIDSGDPSGDRADLKKLASACQETDLPRRWQRLHGILDVERFVSFMALEILICHHDGYSLDRNNFRIYHDPATDRLVFIPHGMDLIFDYADLPVEAPPRSRWRGLVANAVMETEEGRRLYSQRMGELARMVYGTDALQTRIAALSDLLRENLAGSNDAHRRQQLDASIATLRRIVQRRTEFVRARLKAP
jgi:spore coat protein H